MSIERRLQHAARELRSVEVAVPPLAGASPGGRQGAGRRPGLHTIAAPVLFVVGGLFVVGVLGERRPTGSTFDDTSTVVASIASAGAATEAVDDVSARDGTGPADGRSIAAPSAADERAMIDRILSVAERAATPAVGTPESVRPLGFPGPL